MSPPPPPPNHTAPSTHDSNLVDVLLTSALDGEFVRDQISGNYQGYSAPSANKSKAEAVTYSEEELKGLKLREHKAIQAAEQQEDVGETIRQLTQIIDDHPQYASAYNNRAQALRIQGTAPAKDILEDLSQAIQLTQEDTTLLGQAYTQRAIVIRQQALKDNEELTHEQEEEIFFNFSQGAKYGNEVAKVAMAKENPYAKLCGKIMTESMRKLREQK